MFAGGVGNPRRRGLRPAHGHSVQRSFTVHGDAAWAQRRRCELVEDYGIDRVGSSDIPGLNVAELLTRFMAGPHPWKPATHASHRHVVDSLVADPLSRRPLLTLTAGTVRAAIGVGRRAGCRWPRCRPAGWCCAQRSRGRSPSGCCVRTRWSQRRVGHGQGAGGPGRTGAVLARVGCVQRPGRPPSALDPHRRRCPPCWWRRGHRAPDRAGCHRPAATGTHTSSSRHQP